MTVSIALPPRRDLSGLDLSSSGKIVFPDLTISGEPPQGSPVPYVVRQGDCLSRLVFTFGFDAETAWNDPKNADLKAKRKDPNILHPGDIVYVPKAPKQGLAITKGGPNSYTVNQDQGLDPSGTLDAATRAKLQEVHGS